MATPQASGNIPGTLFHQKMILCLPPDSLPSTPPHWVYLGSHNFSQGA